MGKWIALLTMAVAAAAAPLAVAGQDCDPTALAVACTQATSASHASFLNIVADAARAKRSFEGPRVGSDNANVPDTDAVDASAHPVVYMNDGPYGQAAAPASLAVLDTVGGRAAGGWLRLPSSLSSTGPAPSLAWIFVLGFLGFIILRRTRDARAF